MTEFDPFLKSVLENMHDHIVVIGSNGHIYYTNKAWDQFNQSNSNGSLPDWSDQNYLQVCDDAAQSGDKFASQAAAGIRKLIQEKESEFHFEYPCHSPSEQRWFMMSAKPMTHNSEDYIVISHTNITRRKLAEEQAAQLSKYDHLTEIANRRHFDDFLATLWKQNQRDKKPVILALIDLDCFKYINDNAGHKAGDLALIQVAQLLTQITQRPSELCARYGGDEFVVVYSDSNKEEVKGLLEHFRRALQQLNIPVYEDKCGNCLSTSIGLAELTPSATNRPAFLIEAADRLLYCAKNRGRNALVYD